MTQPNQKRQITFRFPCEPGVRWTEQAAQSLIGQTPRLNARAHEGGSITADYGSAVVVAAEVVDDGSTVQVTIETEQRPSVAIFLPDLYRPGLDVGGSSISFTATPADRKDEREIQTLRNQMKAAMVKCCEAGKVAYPDPCPWHGEDGWPAAWRS